jgi:hypothetical protein
MKSRMDKYRDNESNAWALIYNQCLPKLENKLNATDGYSGAKSTNNVAKLLTMIQGYSCQFDILNNKYMATVAAIKNLFYFFQKGDQAIADYHKEFMAMMEVIEGYGGAGSLTHFPNLLKQELKATGMDLSTTTAEELKEGKKTIRKKFLAVLMLNGANGTKYNDLKRSMKKNFVTGMSILTLGALRLYSASLMHTNHPRDGESAGRMLEWGLKKELCLLKLKETTYGRQG